MHKNAVVLRKKNTGFIKPHHMIFDVVNFIVNKKNK